MRQSVVSFSLFAQAATHLNAASPWQCPTAATPAAVSSARQQAVPHRVASLGSRSRQAEPSQSFAMQLLSYNHNFIKHIFTKAFSTLNCIVITAGWAWRAGSEGQWEGGGEHSTSAHLVVASQGERITITNMLAWSLCRSLGLVDCFLLGSQRDRARGRGREVGR